MTDAPTCTVGPSRPIEAPLTSPTKVSNIFPPSAAVTTDRARWASSVRWRAAMACGMPLPCAPGKTIRVTQAQRIKPNRRQRQRDPGRNKNGPNASWARFAAQAKPTPIDAHRDGAAPKHQTHAPAPPRQQNQPVMPEPGKLPVHGCALSPARAKPKKFIGARKRDFEKRPWALKLSTGLFQRGPL